MIILGYLLLSIFLILLLTSKLKIHPTISLFIGSFFLGLLLQMNLNDILEFIDQLKNVDTKGINPLQNVNKQELKMREDNVNPNAEVSDLLKNAPESESHFFSVPKVIE